MHPSPGLASSLAKQAYLRHHGTPVCLHELLVQVVRQQCQRHGVAPAAIATRPPDTGPAPRPS